MNAETYENLLRKQMNEVKAYGVFLLVVAISMGYYLYVQYGEYTMQKQAVVAGNELIAKISEKLDEEKDAYLNNKAQFDAKGKSLEEKISVVFPQTSEELEFTRRIDVLEDEMHTKENPFEVLSINYSNPLPMDTYSVLPFVINISTSYEKMMEFLRLVETSGSLSSGNQLRLMDIESINLTLPKKSDESSGKEKTSYSIRINAYFQQ